MMDSWPEEHGQGYKTALQACTGQLTTPEQVEAARQAFLAATEEAALVVVGAEPAVKATRRRGYLFEKPNHFCRLKSRAIQRSDNHHLGTNWYEPGYSGLSFDRGPG
jgi:hypothetical protein